jgi:Ca2+-binding RTX toxin-like protein
VVTPNPAGTTVYKDAGSGPNVGTYTLQLAVPPPAIATLAYLTVAATPDPLKWATQGGKSIQVSTDGVNYSDALVLTFDSTALLGSATDWSRTQTIWVRAVGDSVADGQLTSIISHAIQSTNPDINLLPITNVEVKVIDNNRPGLVVVIPRNPRVVENGAGPSYTVALTKSPNVGETVSIALAIDVTILALSGNPSQFNALTNTVTFDSTNWNVPFTVNVAHAPADGIVQNERYTNIVMSVSSSDTVSGVYAHVGDQPRIQVDVIDADAPGLLVTQMTDELTVSDGHPATYTIQLLKSPAALTQVVATLLTDGKTLASSDVPDARFHAAPFFCTPSSTAACGPTVVFDSTNWNVAFTVRVSVNPGAPAVVGTQPVMVFPAQPHTLNQMFGPIIIEGEQIIDRSLKPGVKLPTELDVPLPVPPPVFDLGQATDTLNIFNDGSVSNDTGVMGPLTAPGFVAVQALYANSPLCTNAPSSCDAGTFGKVSGLNMSTDPLSFDFGTSTNHNFHTFDAGITYHNIQIVNLMLGQGNDNFTVNSTTQGAITAVNGGGGSDTITVNGGGGPTSPLVVFGDTSQNGQYYDSTTAHLTGHARVFTCTVAKPCNNTLDARNDPNPVVLVGGRGNDTIYGGGGGDQLYGGGGSNVIHAGTGNDHIYGNASINIDLTQRLSLSTQVITVVNDPNGTEQTTGDQLVVGQNSIYGGAGHDIVIGQKGVITQTPGTNRILTTGNVLRVESIDPTQFANTTIRGGSGDSIFIGGSGSDAIDGGSGRSVIIGNNALFDRTTTVGDFRSPLYRALTGTQIYDANGVDLAGTTWQPDPSWGVTPPWWADFLLTLTFLNNYGNNYLAGGPGTNKLIFGGYGNDVIQGHSSIDYRPTTLTSLSCANPGTVGYDNWHWNLLVGACRDASQGTATTPTPSLQINPSKGDIAGAGTDGYTYIEGVGGSDVILGDFGQNDIVGGSSDMFGLTAPAQRSHTGSNLIFGGDGTRIDRNNPGDTSPNGHAHDSDTIVADNGDIFRLVGTGGTSSGHYLTFNYDNYTGATEHIVPRAVRLIDYTPGGPDYNNTVASGPVVPGDLGGPAEIHAEAGDAFIYGGPRNDVIFGGGQNDTIVGGYGNKWISGGAGDDCIIGHDGRCFASRVGTAGEPLYGIAAIPAANVSQLITTPGNFQQAVINKDTALQYIALLFPYNLDPNHAAPSQTYRAAYSNDIIYGGFGSDSIHAGAGESAITGAEAPTLSYTNNYDVNGVQLNTAPIESDWYHPYNPGNPLGYNPATTKFALYDAADPRRKILLTSTGALDKTQTGLRWILDFDSTEGILNNYWAAGTAYAPVNIQGNDAIFGDIGNKWIVGGNGRNRVYGGWGDSMLDIRGTLDFNGGLNDGPVTQPAYESLAFAGAGRDVLIASSGGDRMLDWGGNFNTYLVPFSPFGMGTVDRSPSPATRAYLLALSKSDGADQTVGLRYGGTAARNGEPFGELAMVQPGDAAWQPNHGAPRDKFVFVHAARDVLRFAGLKPIESPGTADPWIGAGAAAAVAPQAPTIQLAPVVNSGRQFAVPIVIGGVAGLVATYSITDGTSTVSGSGTIGADGLFSPVLDLSSLADGLLTASATLADSLGNTSVPGTTTTTKDAALPATPAISLAASSACPSTQPRR